MLLKICEKHQKGISVFFLLLMVVQSLGATPFQSTRRFNPQVDLGRVKMPGKRTGLPVKEPLRPMLAEEKVTWGPDRKTKELPTLTKRRLIDSLAEKVDTRPAIGGPTQPEMAAFKSVGADNMVDLYTGNFSYNIPLGDVGGYPLNIFYSGGAGMDEEASWVGLGWNINPGTITRSKRGIPDDFDSTDYVTKEMNIKPQITVGANTSLTTEILGYDKSAGKLSSSLTVSGGLFYNNYRGLGLEIGSSVAATLRSWNADQKTAFDTVSVKAALGVNINSQSGVNVNPSLELRFDDNEKKFRYGGSLGVSASFNSRAGLQTLSLSSESFLARKKVEATDKTSFRFSPGYASSLNFAIPSITPSIQMPLTHRNYNLGAGWGKEKKPVLYNGKHVGGYYSEARLAENDKVQKKRAFGYLNLQDAANNDDALLDFNRMNDGVYTLSTPVIGIPNYTYDVFSISGQGTGGGFRAYRGDIGAIHDNAVSSRESAASVDVELGAGSVLELGVNSDFVFTPTHAGEWKEGNIARDRLKFTESDKLYQAAYFKNPGESSKVDPDFLEKLGGDDLIRLKLMDPGSKMPVVLPAWERFSDGRHKTGDLSFGGDPQLKKGKRDKRTQLISYLTAVEAASVGVNRTISYFPLNQFPEGNCNNGRIELPRYEIGPAAVHKMNHLSEITVTQTDGKRYVYGIPVYNLQEEDVSFAVQSSAAKDGQGNVSYTNDDLDNNQNGRDWFYQKEKIDPYAYAFLLTDLLSPDYVDVTGDGVTDDDLGTSIHFNYSKIEHPRSASGHGFAWQSPMSKTGGKAAYIPGLKTDNEDDRATYSYGEKELWYLNSIESKTMIAVFHVSDRKDGRAVLNQDEGFGVSTMGMKKLDRIDIYSKAEWVKTTGEKKPIKSINFEYNYTLCMHTPDNNVADSGKLTLTGIYFTYNGIDKHSKNKGYHFKYRNNADYNRMNSDRWGTYKPSSANGSSQDGMDFSALDNTDFPFADQDQTTADANVAAWTLNEIALPSGATINVDFESDDYAYVQNRRAAQMFRIAGFAKTSSATPTEYLYNNPSEGDNFYVFVDVPYPVSSAADIKARYLDGVGQLFMKLWVNMKTDQYGGGPEPISVYALLDNNEGFNYGVVSSNRIWIKVKPDRDGYSPMFYNSMQFMIKNLASKAYPGSDVKGTGMLAIWKSLVGILFNRFTMQTNYLKAARTFKMSKTVDLDKSYIRLNNPFFKKLGGGLRVKKVTIKDGWKEMTSTDVGNTNGMPGSEYGQEYDYTTTAVVNGEETTISSGVAAYEPTVGSEENPFREIMYYNDRQPLGPSQRGAVELPLAESFYPSPSVGYSKVTVRSIHHDNVKSATGKSVSEFYTSRDFPTRSDFTSFDPSSKVRYKADPISRVLKFKEEEVITLSQGFRIQTNDMDGKMKSQTVLDENGAQISFTENIYRISTTGGGGYTFNNTVPMLDRADGDVINALTGKEIEVMTDFREHKSEAVTLNLDFNLNMNEWGGFPVPIPSVVVPVRKSSSMYRSASVLKIVNTFGILEEVRHIEKGSEVSTKDLLYDAETGNTLLTQTNNEFNQPVYNFSYPAHWAYQGMSGGYKNIDVVMKNLRFQNGRLTTPGADMTVFESGDEIYVEDHSLHGAVDEPGCYPSGPIQYIPKPVDENGLWVRKIWALDMQKDPANTTPEFVFIDKNGDPYSGANVTIKIIRSGKRNLVDASVGAISGLANPIRETSIGSGIFKLVVDDQTKLINTTANTFKENWRVDDAWYTQEEINAVVRQTPILTTTVSPAAVNSVEYVRRHQRTEYVSFRMMQDKVFETFKERRNVSYGIGRTGLYTDQNSWAKYVLPSGLSGATVLHAEIQLKPHNADHTAPTFAFGKHHAIEPHYNGEEEGVSFHSDHFIFRLSRSIRPWYDYVDNNSWRQAFEDAGNISNATIVWPIPVMFAPAGGFTQSFNGNITGLVTALVENMDNLTVAPAIKLSFLKNSGKIDQYKRDDRARWRFCFETDLPIKIDYYKCTPSDPIIYDGLESGAPTTPPAGYAFCVTKVPTLYCYSSFTRTRINPYTKGVLGNWRADVSYAYYNNRRESDASVPTEDLAKGGLIGTGYLSFWQTTAADDKSIEMNPDAVVPVGGNPAAWKWTARTTQINSKGFELENTDPLGRFNCAIYGYDQSLPRAVANNSKLRNAASDGFEDYQYESNHCGPVCKPVRHLIIDNAASHISDEERHSGLYSLKLNEGETASVQADVVAHTADDLSYGVTINTTNTTMSGTWVDGLGNGLLGHYFNFGPLHKGFFTSNSAFNDDTRNEANNVLTTNVGYTSQVDPFINLRNINSYDYDNSGIKPPAGIGIRPGTDKSDWFCARWDGVIQAPEAGVYSLAFSSDDGIKVTIDGTVVTNSDMYNTHSMKTQVITTSSWTVGSTHTITIFYYERGGDAQATLSWKTPYSVDFEVIPQDYLYQSTGDASGTVISGTYTCKKLNQVQVKDNALTDIFSPLQGEKMVFSAWVKEGTGDCHCSGYPNNKVEILFDNSTTASATFYPSGKVIEGWQRYEAVFDIPASATHLEVKMYNSGSEAVYWDDLRLHPYNSTMKTFVYHPTTLRLTAEQDENNYSTFYEYDDEGTLTRVKAETVQGIKTVKETRSAIQKKIN